MTYIPLAVALDGGGAGGSSVSTVGSLTAPMASALVVPTPGSDVYGISVPTPSLIPPAVPQVLGDPAPVGPTAPNLVAGVVQAIDSACGCNVGQQLTAPAGQSTAGLTGASIPAPVVGSTNLTWLWLVLAVVVLWALSR